jgi:alanine racemase
MAASPASGISTSSTPPITTDTEPPVRLARAVVDLEAIGANWKAFSALEGLEEASAVVKADAYGLGMNAVAPFLASIGARTFFVASAGEGLALRRLLGPGPVIWILNGPQSGEAPAFAEAALSPVLNSLTQIADWRTSGVTDPVAVHVDTGMNRLGLSMEELHGAREALERTKVSLVMSHLACAATPDHPMNAQQARRFEAAAAIFPGATPSLGASAGALLGRAFRKGLIRPGIGLYGDNGLDHGGPALAAALTIVAPVLQLRDVQPGAVVGYGATGVITRPTRLATIALGYADGYFRTGSGRGYGAFSGIRCPVVGRVSMDILTLDMTDAVGVAVGDDVEILGPNVPIKDVAAAFGTSPYEVLTGFAKVARRYRVVSA